MPSAQLSFPRCWIFLIVGELLGSQAALTEAGTGPLVAGRSNLTSLLVFPTPFVPPDEPESEESPQPTATRTVAAAPARSATARGSERAIRVDGTAISLVGLGLRLGIRHGQRRRGRGGEVRGLTQHL